MRYSDVCCKTGRLRQDFHDLSFGPPGEVTMDGIRFPDEHQMTAQHKAALTKLLNREDFRALRRSTWLPLTRTGEDRLAASKYGGRPWLSQGGTWPTCGHYRCPMHRKLTDEERDLLDGWGLIDTGDKLAGRPAWIHSSEPEYTVCRTCSRDMHLAFQFEPHVRLNFSSGQEFFDRPVDTGCGWLFQCPEHKSRLSFTWQCHWAPT
jgi:hypothetical protein